MNISHTQTKTTYDAQGYVGHVKYRCIVETLVVPAHDGVIVSGIRFYQATPMKKSEKKKARAEIEEYFKNAGNDNVSGV